MIEPFPLEHELLSFFEVEPTLTDRDAPRYYNRLTFVSVRGSDRIECEIEPADEIVEFRWVQDGVQRIWLKLESVDSMRVETSSGVETLLISCRPPVPAPASGDSVEAFCPGHLGYRTW
jgi:hypothetical protein